MGATKLTLALGTALDGFFAGLGPAEVSIHFAEELVGGRVRLQ